MGDVRIRARDDAGMTLPELLVVMAIVAVLVAVALPLFFNQQAKAYDSAVQSDLTNVAIAVRVYVDESSTVPAITADGDGYVLDGDALPTSPGVILTAISGGLDDYCFAATHPSGKTAKEVGYHYTVHGGIKEGGCPTATAASS
ncbi:prepilin-type N-terminal cleavage/methylation domain-containing protein [Demequina sp. NBRC 110057]|uniref:prepilin-type N-terminal cleavage/methylation domain-containing protein n=1 Tax=Demequina sp. NBRC 110057 TaxID=1570346 RepID=UPI0009FE0ED7|nr:prepilin-type N-terminal cleavage/methylation domain-containing protein [Demequina sp. NBRC 110057]